MIKQAEEIKTFDASGKLMLLGEYLVLSGAKSLSFPLKFGQTLSVEPSDSFKWSSRTLEGEWFNVELNESLEVMSTNNEEVAAVLQGLIKYIAGKNPTLDLNNTYIAEANFNLQWGLGSSSTLISLLSQWSGVDAQELLKASFGGSGYDVECAVAKTPITYTIDGAVEQVSIPKEITDHCLFVYLGKKQNSRSEIKRFSASDVAEDDVKKMDALVDQAVSAEQIEAFEGLLQVSEDFLSPIIGRTTLKKDKFADYPYAIKSLGAWGGDFFLATYRDLEEAKTYFEQHGLNTMFTYNELIK